MDYEIQIDNVVRPATPAETTQIEAIQAGATPILQE